MENKTNFWLYLGNKSLTCIRLPSNTIKNEIIRLAATQCRNFPCVSSLWPESNPYEIVNLILNPNVTVKVFPNEG